jgi:heterodisulfide reductase subunit A
MMTAYATVETAVEAMKIGALDYLIKPFDPDALIPKVISDLSEPEYAAGPELEVGAIVMSGGTSYYNPAEGKDTYGVRVVCRMWSRASSSNGCSAAPAPPVASCGGPRDGRPITRIAWLQCVGSRDLQKSMRISAPPSAACTPSRRPWWRASGPPAPGPT